MTKRRKTVIIIFITIIILCVISSKTIFEWQYPYGMRSGVLPGILNALYQYADENNGFFPAEEGANPLSSLQKLNPGFAGKYLLAGISGDIKTTGKVLSEKGELNSTHSSWIYYPGLHYDDNTDIAIIWERQEGITFNGSRVESGSHAVGFINAQWKQIPKEEWDDFVKQQKKLRDEVLKKRKKTKNEKP